MATILDRSLISDHTGTSILVNVLADTVKLTFLGTPHNYLDEEEYVTHYCQPLLASNHSYDSVLVGGLGMGLIPEWIANNTSCTTIHVIDNNSELRTWVSNENYLDSSINIYAGDAYTYTPTQNYDLILMDIWWGSETEATDGTGAGLKDRYIPYLNSGGKYYAPCISCELFN